MKRKRFQWMLALCLLPALIGVRAYFAYSTDPAGDPVDNISLLVPDDIGPNHPVVREWMDAAGEEGLHLSLLHDSEFLSPLQRTKPIAGLIIPDLIHRSANATLVGALHEYVHKGGDLMVVYDACTYDLANHFARVQSRLSDLVGVSYALYDRYRTDSIHWGSVWGEASTMRELGIPPGKYIPARQVDTGTRRALQKVDLPDGAANEQPDREAMALSRYEYGDLSYPAFRTNADFDGKILLRTSGGIGAGVRKDNLGHVLFVNLPLSYLESRTDGLLLHSFLRYFGVKLIGLPYLSSVPDGIGGMVFNWHIDAKAMAPPLQKLVAAGIFNRGPFSVHFTAGPDDDQFGDGKGLNVGHDPQTDALIRELMRRGHSIGSHGGWIHNYFGEHVSDDNEQEFSKYLQWNAAAIEKVTGKPVTEYSAPLGNHPAWVSHWLEKNHIDSYYFAGDTGMGPTQVYRDSVRDGNNIWAFPIVHLGRYASLEEMGFANLDPQYIQDWLDGVADFVADDRSARLIYTHSFGATRYIAILQQFLKHTDQLQRDHRFQWYTMSQLADFLNVRKAVQWSLVEPKGTGSLLLKASNPNGLNHETWVFPKVLFEPPRIRRGRVQLSSDGTRWLVDAGDSKDILVEIKRKQEL